MAGLHTALDTSGFPGRHASDALLDATDLVLLDIKAGDEETHRRITARPLRPTLEFAEQLGNVERVNVLPFHKLGQAKWERLGRECAGGSRRTAAPALNPPAAARAQARRSAASG